MEQWDLFDSERKPLCRTCYRGEQRAPGEYHIVIGVWVVNSQKQVLVTLRDALKSSYPLTWENTGGSALAGESSKQAAIRELFEETGIVAKEDELVMLGSTREESAFFDLYILHKNVSLSEIVLQPGETIDAKWLSLQELDEICADGSLARPIAMRLSTFRKEFDAFIEAM